MRAVLVLGMSAENLYGDAEGLTRLDDRLPTPECVLGYLERRKGLSDGVLAGM